MIAGERRWPLQAADLQRCVQAWTLVDVRGPLCGSSNPATPTDRSRCLWRSEAPAVDVAARPVLGALGWSSPRSVPVDEADLNGVVPVAQPVPRGDVGLDIAGGVRCP